jgi:YVTN family beta-propeller protein
MKRPQAPIWPSLQLKGLMALSLVALAACDAPKRAPAAAAANYKVYVTNERSGDLTAIDGATGRVAATYPLGKRPRGIQVSRDGRTLYIALSGSPIAGPGVDESKLPPPDKSADGIGVFDIASAKLVRTITGMSDPEQMVLVGDRLYIASEDSGTVVVIALQTGKILANIPVGSEPEGMNLSPDGKTVWTTSEGEAKVYVIDAATNAVIKAIEVGKRPRSIAFSPDGARAYISGEADRVVKVIDTKSLEVVNTVKMAGDALRPMDVVTSPDGRRLYVSTGRGKMVVALDAVALTQEASVEVGARPWGIALSPDGKTLYSANGSSDDVAVVDTATMAVKAKLPAGKGPWGVAVVAAPPPPP